MEQECVVFGCRNSSTILQTKKNDCNFFSFPLNQPDLVEKWLKKICLEGWTPGPENVICEEHFSLDSFEIINDKRILKSEALPSMIDDWRRIVDDDILEPLNDETENENSSKDLRCRICANFLSYKDAIDIYSKDDNVMEKMMACIPILVKAVDMLPKHICRLCLTDLNISYRMLVRAIESEKLFNNILSKSSDKSQSNNVEEISAEKINSNEKHLPSECVICNVQFTDVNDLSVHFQDKHVNEFEFNEQNVQKSQQIDCISDKYRGNLLSCMEVKQDDDDFKNETVIELDYDPDAEEQEQEKSENDTDQYPITEKQNIKKKYSCDICSMSFASKDILDFHTENFHKTDEIQVRPAKSESMNSNEEPDDEEIIESNADEDMEREYSVCQFCMQLFSTVTELNKHLETHIESLVCDECGCLCQDDEKLKKHRETHSKRYNKNNACPVCFTVFLTHADMMQHSKDVHRVKDIKDEAAPQKWICKYCGKEIGTKLSLSIHERIHTGVRPYVCECCGRSFKSKANLIQHQPVHTGVKRYKCSVCDKAFARKAFVTTHMRVHTGERPFKCEICGNRYTQIGDMRRHKKRHIIGQTNNTSKRNIVEVPARTEAIEDVVETDKIVPIEHGTMLENNGLIKLHFAKDVTDFRRILVELQQ